MIPRNLNDLAPFLFVVAYILLGAAVPITLRTGLLFPGSPGGRSGGLGKALITRPECSPDPAPAISFYPQYKF